VFVCRGEELLKPVLLVSGEEGEEEQEERSAGRIKNSSLLFLCISFSFPIVFHLVYLSEGLRSDEETDSIA